VSDGNFKRVVVGDFEYEVTDGGLPNPLCFVGYVLDEHLERVDTIRLWRDEFGSAPPFDIGPDTIFAAYSAWAEMTCFMQLGWRFPTYIFDQHTAHLAATNKLLPYDPDEVRKRPPKRLPDACRTHGLEGWERIDKDHIARDIGDGLWRKYGREAVFAYCEEDVRMTVRLLRAQVSKMTALDIERVIHWSDYSAKVIALIQARGMPIDVPRWDLVQEYKATNVTSLIRKFDPSQGTDRPIYSPAGEWSDERFEQWLVDTGVVAWPRLDSGKISLESDTFRMMSHIPGIEGLSALRDSLRVIAHAKLPIGPDGRNRPSLFPFGTATGRNAHRKSLFNAHAGMRSFMKFAPEKIGVYLDWRTQEVGVVASQSGDQPMINAYRGGDVYYDLARTCGLTDDRDRIHWAKNNQPVRQRMKSLQLAINYGMGVPSLARGLNRHPVVASTIIEMHRRKHERFWEWREEQVCGAMLSRRIESVFGWPLHLSVSPNKRTLYNFPAQSGGAEMLRLAAVRLCEAGLVPSMLIHDGILLELDTLEQVEHAKEIMRQAGREVCNGLEIGVDTDQLLEHGARYRDKRPVAKEMWSTMMASLQEVGALPQGAEP
jgi:DNA polymerase I